MRKLSDLKVHELHDELAKLGLSKKGKKAELVERLTEYIREQGSDPAEVDFDESDALANIGKATSQAEEGEDQIEEQEQETSEKAAAEDQTGEDTSSNPPTARKSDEESKAAAVEEDEEAQVIHQTDEPLTAEQRAELTATIDMKIPLAGTADDPIVINSSQSSQEYDSQDEQNSLSTTIHEDASEDAAEATGDDAPSIEEMETNEKEATEIEKETEELAPQLTETESVEKKEDAGESEKIQDEAKEDQGMEIQQETEGKAEDKEKLEQQTQPGMETAEDKQADPGTVLLTGFRAAPTEEAVFAVLEGFNPSDFICKEIGEKNYKIEVRVSSKSAFVTKFKNGCTVGDDTVSASDPKYKERKRSHSSEPNKNEDSKKSKLEEKPKTIAEQIVSIEADMKRREKTIEDDRKELEKLRDAEKRSRRDIEDFGRDIKRMRDNVNRVRDDCRRMRDERKNYERDLDKLKSLLKTERELLEDDRRQLRRVQDDLKRVNEERRTTKEQSEREKLELERRQLAEERRRFAEERERMERERNMYRSRNRSPVQERRVEPVSRESRAPRDPYSSAQNYSRSNSTPHPNPYDRPPRAMVDSRDQRRNEYSRSQSSSVSSYQNSRAPEYRPVPSYQSGPDNGYGKPSY